MTAMKPESKATELPGVDAVLLGPWEAPCGNHHLRSRALDEVGYVYNVTELLQNPPFMAGQPAICCKLCLRRIMRVCDSRRAGEYPISPSWEGESCCTRLVAAQAS